MLADPKQSKSALHTEDATKWQKSIGECLQEAGYDVTQAVNLQDAEEHVRRQKFDLYVVDGTFPLKRDEPGLSLDLTIPLNGAGLRLYEKIRQIHGNNLNYVIVSGDDELKRVCYERVIRFFSKTKFDRKSFMDYLKSLQ